MPPRRTATTTVEQSEETTEPTEDPKPDKSTIKDTILEVLGELGLTGKGTPTEEPAAETTEVEEIESPRQQESRMRQQVEAALPALHIHMDRETPREESKKEPEQSPAKTSRLAKFVGLS